MAKTACPASGSFSALSVGLTPCPIHRAVRSVTARPALTAVRRPARLWLVAATSG